MGKFVHEQGKILHEVGKIVYEPPKAPIFSLIPKFTRFVQNFNHFTLTRREEKRGAGESHFLLENVKKMQKLATG